jgi:hypothetical protein
MGYLGVAVVALVVVLFTKILQNVGLSCGGHIP